MGPSHLKPKTSHKTSHFLLNDAMFQRCFEKNIDLDVFDDVWKKPKHRINDASNDVNRPPLPVVDSYSWQTCAGHHLLFWWWRPVVTPTLLYSTLTLFGRPVVYTIYSFELMAETCGEHLLHWWQVYKCSPETPAVGAVRWKGDLTEHLSSVPTEFSSPLSLSSS